MVLCWLPEHSVDGCSKVSFRDVSSVMAVSWMLRQIANENFGLRHYNKVMTVRPTASAPNRGAHDFLQRHLKLRHLRLLVALDQHRHVGRVAAALHITQPAVSKMLAEIERGLGVPLFVRTPKGLLPTQEGDCLIRYAQSVEDDLHRAALALNSVGQPQVWRLTVGAGQGTTPLVSRAFARLQCGWPADAAFNLTVQEGQVEMLLPLLRAGRLDVLMGSTPEQSATADLHVVPLYLDPLVWIAAPGHPLVGKARLALGDLVGPIWVLPPHAVRTRAIINAELRRRKVSIPSRLVETVSYDTLLGMVCDQGAIALLTKQRARSAESRGLVRVLDVDMGNAMTHISAMTVSEPDAGSPAAQFVQCLEEASAP